MSTAEQKDKLNNSDAIRHILQSSNDILHQAITNKDIVVIATQDKADKSKFKIVADSVYEKELEGVILTFSNPQDYIRLFPTEPGNGEPPIRCPPNTELDPITGKCVPIAPDTYTVLQIVSQPKSQTPQFHEKNVLDGQEDTKWAINQKGASLTLDLGSVVDVGTVWIWWGDGDKRSFYFNIGTSQTEDQDFTNIWTDYKMSSGKVNDFEPYVVSNKCRFIHITVNGNTVNQDWAAISNIKVTKAIAVESAEVDIPSVPPVVIPPVVEPPVVTPPVVDPNQEPPKPIEGRLQPEKGANQDANKWKAVSMQKQPELWKVVDLAGVNVADQFTKEANCNIFIKWYQWKQKQTPPVTPPPVVEPPVVTPPPQPTGKNITKDGVQIPYNITGNIEYIYRNNDRDDGKRMDFDKFKANTYVNSAVLGYFAFPNGKVPDDEVSGKWSVEGHSDGTDPKCYDLGVKTVGGQSRWRFESPHPTYTSDLGKGKENGVSLGKQFVGYMFIRKNLPNGKVALEIWQDAGNNEVAKPANQWKQLAYWEDSKYKITNYPNGPQVTIRIDGSNVVKDMALKYVSCVELAPTL